MPEQSLGSQRSARACGRLKGVGSPPEDGMSAASVAPKESQRAQASVAERVPHAPRLTRVQQLMRLPVMHVAAMRELLRERLGGHPVSDDHRPHLEEAIKWLVRAQ